MVVERAAEVRWETEDDGGDYTVKALVLKTESNEEAEWLLRVYARFQVAKLFDHHPAAVRITEFQFLN